MSNSQVTTESGGRQNMFPTETRPYIDNSVSYEGYPQNAEKVNGRWAKRERVRHNHVEDGPSNVVSGKIFGALTFSELSKYDQAMVE